MNIRKATEDDLFDLLVLAREFMREAPDMYNFEKDRVEAQLKATLQNPNMVLLVAEDNGEVEGGLVGIFTNPPFSGLPVASELAWFVSKDKRNRKTALGLLKAFEDWGKSMGAKFLVMADITPLSDLESLYSRKGYTVIEKSYGKEVV